MRTLCSTLIAFLSLHVGSDIASTSSFTLPGSYSFIPRHEFVCPTTKSRCAIFLERKGARSIILSLAGKDISAEPSEIDNTENKDRPMNMTIKSDTSEALSKDIVSFSELGDYDPSERLKTRKKDIFEREVLVGDPQLKVKKKDQSIATILQELAAIQKQGPKKYCILGTRHCSFLHQQIIELLSYALVLSENHVYTSGAGGTNAAAIKGALRAERPDLLTVILPQSIEKQPRESQELIRNVTDLITMPQNDHMSLDVASQLCNSMLLRETDQLIAFAFHESQTVIEATKEAKKLEKLVTLLFLD